MWWILNEDSKLLANPPCMLKPISLLQSKWKIRSWCVSLRANYSGIAFNLVFKEGDSKGEDYLSCHLLNFLIIFFDGTIFLLTMENREKKLQSYKPSWLSNYTISWNLENNKWPSNAIFPFKWGLVVWCVLGGMFI